MDRRRVPAATAWSREGAGLVQAAGNHLEAALASGLALAQRVWTGSASLKIRRGVKPWHMP